MSKFVYLEDFIINKEKLNCIEMNTTMEEGKMLNQISFFFDSTSSIHTYSDKEEMERSFKRIIKLLPKE